MSKKSNLLKKTYLDDFLHHQASLIKNRVGFFCLLSIIIYLLATAMSFVIIPRSLHPDEIRLFQFLFLGTGLIYILVKRARSIFFTKFYAYIYTGVLLFVLTKLNIIYPAYIRISIGTYIFLLFFVTFSIPWRAFETFILTTLHILAYTGLFMYVHNNMPEKIQQSFDVFYYFGGFILLCMGFVLCFIVRRKESTRELENFILLRQQQSRNAQIKKELDLAARVYETLVPKPIETDFFDIDIIYMPVSYMSGDYGKYYFVDKDLLIFIICDVTGHGASAALLVNRMHTEFMKLVKEGKEPNDILKELNSFIINEFGDLNMYMSAFCGLADLQEMRLAYSNYGHPNQYLYSKAQAKIFSMPSETTLLGITENPQTDSKPILPLSKGDRIILFTDGLTEIEDDINQEYGKKRLEEFILNNPNLSPKAFNQSLLNEIRNFKEGDFKDDIFLVNIMVKS